MNKRLVAGTVIVLFLSTWFMPSIIGDSIGFKQDETSYCTTINEGTLSGYVTDTSMNPIEGAKIRVNFHGTYEENYSDAFGYYHVTNIPICYCLKNATCSKEGYKTEWVLLSIDEDTTYDFVLTSLSIPDLECEGDLLWRDVEPGSTVTGEFFVENIGDPDSELDWEIVECPDWGSWIFSPSSSNDLTPEDGPLIVEVEVIVPDDPEMEFDGEIVVVNSEDPDDFCTIIINFDPYIKHQYETQNNAEIIKESRSCPIFVFPIIGLYPDVSENTISFWMLKWITITKDRFKGHIGDSIIFGAYVIGGPV